MSVDNQIGVVDILAEFLEVAVHNIIYVRRIYPQTIFVPRKKYGVTVYQAIHPGVREYINHSLKAVVFHGKNNQLKRFFVCFESDNILIEKFVFDVLAVTELQKSDVFMVQLEQSLRNFLLKLHSSQIYLKELPSEATFSIQLQTTYCSNLEFNSKPSFENFPWIEQNNSDYTSEDTVAIVPVHTVETEYIKLQMYVEK